MSGPSSLHPLLPAVLLCAALSLPGAFPSGAFAATGAGSAESAQSAQSAQPAGPAALALSFVPLPGGVVTLGSPADDPVARPNERPGRTVSLAPFQMATTPVTVAQFNLFRTATPDFDDPTFHIRNRYGADRPVAVSWQDAQAFIAWVNASKPAHDQGVYRLPSEAEWEYAARAGAATRYGWGDTMEPGRANCAGCGSLWDGREPAPAGTFGPNPFGLYDMAGNIWQWVADCWNNGHAQAPADGAPVTVPGCNRRVLKGGTWKSAPDLVRPAVRVGMAEDHRSANDGFRLVRIPGP